MVIKSYRVTNGTLTLGEVATAVDWSAQATKCTVKPAKKAGDPTPVLSGDELAGELDFTWTLTATLLQDGTDNGMVEWCMTHRGQQVPFEFQPAADQLSVSGTVTVEPIEYGGEAKSRPTSDIEWTIVGDPTFAASL